MLAFEKHDEKDTLWWLNIVGFQDSSMPYVFPAFVLFYFTEVELYEIKFNGCMEKNNSTHTTSSSKDLPSPGCLIVRNSCLGLQGMKAVQ